jgi:hypothetical protein
LNRIDEIKVRSKGISEYMHDADKAEIHRQDVQYLLSRIEIAERVLNKILDDRVKDLPAENVVPVYRELAFQALQQLRS